jgi:hypothetical protein
MAAAVATPLEAQFSTIAGVENMTSVRAPRARPASPSNSSWSGTSMPPPWTCSPPLPPPCASCRQTCPRRPPSAR